MTINHLDKLVAEAYATSIWRPASITTEPETQLTQWQVYKVKNNAGEWDIHFMGYAVYEGRVCSAVQEFDSSTMRGRTKSGRIYELVGTQGFNRDAEYVWARWLNIYGNPEVICISDEYGSINNNLGD